MHLEGETLLQILLKYTLLVIGLLAALWTGSALWFQLPGATLLLRGAVVGGWALITLALATLAFRLPRVALMGAAATAVLVALWWISITPKLERDWAPDVARTVTGEIAGDLVTLTNVRDFQWRTADEADERWQTRQYDLSKLTDTSLVLSYWGIDAIAHTLISFGFSDGQRVVFSIEIRRQKGQKFSSIAGFFKAYELAFIAAQEEDILYLRTNMRGEDTYLYPLDISPQAGAALFRTYVSAANERAVEPQFYNTLTTNCTTVIFELAKLVEPGIPTDWRILASGYLPGYLVDHDAAVWKLPERELRERAAISAKAKTLSMPDASYSDIIRSGN